MRDMMLMLTVYEGVIVEDEDGEPRLSPTGKAMHYSTGIISGLEHKKNQSPDLFTSILEAKTAMMGRSAARSILEQKQAK